MFYVSHLGVPATRSDRDEPGGDGYQPIDGKAGQRRLPDTRKIGCGANSAIPEPNPAKGLALSGIRTFGKIESAPFATHKGYFHPPAPNDRQQQTIP